MNYQLLLPLLATTIVAIVGWLVGHKLNTRRDRQNKRREIRVQYLIEAYRCLEAGSCRDLVPNTDFSRRFESAIADIQLFGTKGQAEMAKELAEGMASQENPSGTCLLISLREALRRELGLVPLNTKPIHLRIEPGDG